MKKDRIIQLIDTREEKLLNKLIKQKKKTFNNVYNYSITNMLINKTDSKDEENIHFEQLKNIKMSLLDNELNRIVKLTEKMIKTFMRKCTFLFYEKNGTNRCTKVIHYLQTLKSFYLQCKEACDVSNEIRIIDSYINEMRVILKYMDLVYQKTVSIVDAVTELMKQIPKMNMRDITTQYVYNEDY